MRLRLRKEPVQREKTLRLVKRRLRKVAKQGREKTLRIRLHLRQEQEAKVARYKLIKQRLRQKEEAPVARETSYESLLRWGENLELEPTDYSNGADMEVDYHINQLADACDAVPWKVEEENVKIDGSEETVESVEEEIQSDSHTIVASFLDEMVDLAVVGGGYDVPTPSDTSDTLHDSGPWEYEDAHVQPQEEAIVDEQEGSADCSATTSSLWEVEDAHVQEEAVVDQPVEVPLKKILGEL